MYIRNWFVMMTLLLFNVTISEAQQRVTINELNTYEDGLTTVDDLPNHPLVNEMVEFTAIIVGYPRNSGLASYNADLNRIGRIHVFVVDTTAASEGRDGMYMQIVQGSGQDTFNEFEGLERGDIIDVTASLTFFGNTVQMSVDEIGFNFESVFDAGNERYLDLLEPTVVTMEEVNFLASDGYNVNLENYTKFANRYVKFEQATVINSLQADEGRPWFYIRQGNGNIYTTDYSLRFRNDRTNTGYRDGYNWRRAEDGPYRPPEPGSIIDLSGFLVINTFDPDNVDGAETTFNIAPWGDGVIWRGEGDDVVRTEPDNHPNDLNVIGNSPVFSNFTLSPGTTPTTDDDVEISISISLEPEHTLNSVKVDYNSTDDAIEPAIEDMIHEGDGTYSFTFPSFAGFTNVTFSIVVDFDINFDGQSINVVRHLTDGTAIEDGIIIGNYFVQDDVINSISTIQKTSDGSRGDSPLTGFEELEMDITATVVSTFEDGFIILHDSNEPWSGIALGHGGSNLPQDIRDWQRGDVIHITQADVRSDNTNTFLDNVIWTKVDSHTNWEDMVPVVTVLDLVNDEDLGKPYNDMLVQLTDTYIYTRFPDAPSNFNEWAIADDPRDIAKSLRINNNHGANSIRAGDNIPNQLNLDLREDSEFSSIFGVVHFSFSNPKLALRSLDDITPVEDFTYPMRTIQLFDITNESESTASPLVVDSDLTVSWQTSIDFDGDEVEYIFKMYENGDIELESPVLTANTFDNEVVLSEESMQDLFALLDVADNETVDLIWTVFLSDGRDIVQTSTFSDLEFIPVVKDITLLNSDGFVETEIQFAVNVDILEELGIFSVAAGDKMFVPGNFNGWDTSSEIGQMSYNPQNDKNIWTFTYDRTENPIVIGTELRFKYFTRWSDERFDDTSELYIPFLQPDIGWEEPISNGGTDRLHTITEQTGNQQVFSDEIGYHFYNDINSAGLILQENVIGTPESMPVTFRVDMTKAMSTGVEITDPNAIFLPDEHELLLVLDDQVFTFTQKIPPYDSFIGQSEFHDLLRFSPVDSESNIYELTLELQFPTINSFGFRLAWGWSDDIRYFNGGGTVQSGRRYYQFIEPVAVIDKDGTPVSIWPEEYVFNLLEFKGGENHDGSPLTVEEPPTYEISDFRAMSVSTSEIFLDRSESEIVTNSFEIENMGELPLSGTISVAATEVSLSQTTFELVAGEAVTVSFSVNFEGITNLESEILIESDQENVLGAPAVISLKTLPDLQAEIIGPNQGWRMLGAPVAGTTYEDFLSEIWTQGFEGTRGGSEVASNVYFYKEPTQSWGMPENITNTLGFDIDDAEHSAGKGILVYVYEDDYGDGTSTSWPKVLTAFGDPNSGDIDLPLSFSEGDQESLRGWHLVSNPYDFSVDWRKIVAAGDNHNVSDIIFLWDANAMDGSGSYRLNYGIDIPHLPEEQSFDGIIPPFQGFWVKAYDEDAVLTFRPSHEYTELELVSENEKSDPSFMVLSAKTEQNSESIIIGIYDHPEFENYLYQPPQLSDGGFQMYTTFNGVEPLLGRNLLIDELHEFNIPIHISPDHTIRLEGVLSDELIDKLAVSLRDNLTGDVYPFDESGLLLLEEITTSGEISESRFELVITSQESTGLPNESQIPETFSLSQNFPNPFNPTTQIQFGLPQSSHVSLEVYTVTGQLVARLVNSEMNPGFHQVTFDGIHLSSGVYLYRIQADQFVQTRKLLLIK